MSNVTAKLEDNSVYIFLNLRGAATGFHWGLYVPTNKPEGDVWHAINRSGGWSLETETTSGVPNSESLCLCFKVGTVNSETWNTLKIKLGQVPASGQPSPNTQEAFTCRVWVKDALLALHNAGVICLTKTIATIEADAIRQAEKNRSGVELGEHGAMVCNYTGVSTTS